MIGPSDLVPENSSDADEYHLGFSYAGSNTSACLRAGVHLPQGARMISVRTSYSSGAGSDLTLALWRVNPVTGGADTLVSKSVANDSGVRTYVNHAVPANLGLVNNALFTYTYLVCVGPGTPFYGTRIAYQYTSAGD